jgi:hypothetical protein
MGSSFNDTQTTLARLVDSGLDPLEEAGTLLPQPRLNMLGHLPLCR